MISLKLTGCHPFDGLILVTGTSCINNLSAVAKKSFAG
jgi:hypothetical protein